MTKQTPYEQLQDSLAAVRKDVNHVAPIIVDVLDNIDAVLVDFERRLANLEAINIQVKAARSE